LLGRINQKCEHGKDEEKIRQNRGLDRPVPSGAMTLAMAKMAVGTAIEQRNAHILQIFCPGRHGAGRPGSLAVQAAPARRMGANR